jgi:hypothetical protein
MLRYEQLIVFMLLDCSAITVLGPVGCAGKPSCSRPRLHLTLTHTYTYTVLFRPICYKTLFANFWLAHHLLVC